MHSCLALTSNTENGDLTPKSCLVLLHYRGCSCQTSNLTPYPIRSMTKLALVQEQPLPPASSGRLRLPHPLDTTEQRHITMTLEDCTMSKGYDISAADVVLTSRIARPRFLVFQRHSDEYLKLVYCLQ